MSRRRPAFLQSDLTRVFRAAKAAGVNVRVKITEDVMDVIMGDQTGDADEAIAALEAWQRKKGPKT
jgi:thymidine phosphorylase